jgi:hypothetical protein
MSTGVVDLPFADAHFIGYGIPLELHQVTDCENQRRSRNAAQQGSVDRIRDPDLIINVNDVTYVILFIGCRVVQAWFCANLFGEGNTAQSL